MREEKGALKKDSPLEKGLFLLWKLYVCKINRDYIASASLFDAIRLQNWLQLFSAFFFPVFDDILSVVCILLFMSF